MVILHCESQLQKLLQDNIAVQDIQEMFSSCSSEVYFDMGLKHWTSSRKNAKLLQESLAHLNEILRALCPQLT